MSSESLAAQFGRILTKNPECDGFSDAQVEEFLKLYDQVPSSVKEDKEQLETLLECSKSIARTLDDNDMPSFTVSVQGFKFNPPSIQSDLPCHLTFRILPGSGKQIISIQDSNNKAVATSGILDPQQQNTFTTTICSPGSYVFTSEIYPFMAGQLTTTGTASAADTVTATAEDGEQPSTLVKSSATNVGAAPAVNSQQLTAKSTLKQQDDQQLSVAADGRPRVKAVDQQDLNLQDTAAAAPVNPLISSSAEESMCTGGSSSKRVSDAADGLMMQPSEAGMLELLSLPGAVPHHPHAVAASHISYQGELSRAGRYARRATQYGDEPEADLTTPATLQEYSESTGSSHQTDADASSEAAVSRAVGDGASLLHSAAAAAAAATSAAHAEASVCSSAGARSAALWGDQRTSTAEGPVDMDIDKEQQQQQQLSAVAGTAQLGFAKGLESLEASLRFTPEPVSSTATTEGGIDEPALLQEPAAVDEGDLQTTEQQGYQLLGDGVESNGAVSDSSINSAIAACMYEPLASNSDQHSSDSSDAGDSDSSTPLANGTRRRRGWFRGEGVHLLAEGSESFDREVPRRTWVTAAAAAMGGRGSVTWAQRHSNRSSRPDSDSEEDPGSSSESSADVDVRLRRVMQQQHKQQQQQQHGYTEVLRVQDVDDEDVEPVSSSTASHAQQGPLASAATGPYHGRSAGVAVQTELPPFRRPYRGLTAADAMASTAAGRMGGVLGGSGSQEPPGAKWTLGGKATFAAGSGNGVMKSTFTSTGDIPGSLNLTEHSSRNGGRSRWVVTNGLGSGGQHSSLEQATAVAAAGADQMFKGANGSYFDKHVAGRKQSSAAGSGFSSGTSLGPGKYVLSSSSARVDDPAAQYAAISGSRQQQSGQPADMSAGEGTAADDSDEEPADVRVRAQRLLQQQQLQAAAAKQADADQQKHLHLTTSSSSSNVTAATKAAAAAASKKKKGRKTVAASIAGVKDKSAADARRREREEMEYALYDRGSGSRGDSEDEAAGITLKPSRLSSSTAAVSSSKPDELSVSSTAEAARQLTKCKFKSCKLLFASDLNKNRCHMSHLPSARNTTTKSYKAEVLAFLRALPQSAIAQLLQLPEPSQLPRRQTQLQQLAQQHHRGAKGSIAAAAAAESSTAAAIERLQGMGLSDAWAEQSTLSDDAVMQRSDALMLVSELAQLCCQRPSSPRDEGDASDQDESSESPNTLVTTTGAQTSQSDNTAAAALAAAHAELLHGACCSICTCGTGRSAVGILDCSCSCHAGPALPPVQQPLPPLDEIIAMLERASEGTWLCNPRLLQQPHTSCCCCSVCVGIVAAAGGSGSKGSSNQQDESAAIMESISSGLDVLDVFGEWNVDDASLSYAVERRLITAFHKAKDAEARRVMNQLLEDTQNSTSASQQQQPAAAAAAARKKDRKKGAKASKATSTAGGKKVPAWKAVSSDQDSDGGSDTEQQAAGQVVLAADSTAVAAGPAVATTREHDEPVYESPSKGKYVAEQLLQARLLQQDLELYHLRCAKQQQGQTEQHGVQNVSLQQQQQQPAARRPVPQPAKSTKHQLPTADMQQSRKPGSAAAAAAASGSSRDRPAATSKQAAVREQHMQDAGRQQSIYTRHARTNSSGSGAGAAAAPLVLVVPRRRSSEGGSSRYAGQPAAAAVAATVNKVTSESAAAAPAATAGKDRASSAAVSKPLVEAATVGPIAAAETTSAGIAPQAGMGELIAHNQSTAAEDLSVASEHQDLGTAAAAVMEPLESPASAAAAATASSEPMAAPEAESQQHQHRLLAAQQQQMYAQQHQAMLLQQHCMAFAQQQAYQHVFVASGRAAALASGQEVAPFTPEEQQVLSEWYAYYYQQAYMAASQHMQLMQQQQQQQLGLAAGSAAYAAAAADPKQEAGSSRSGSPVIPQQQQQQQEEGEASMQLQFGSFPVDFTMASPDAKGTAPSSATCGSEASAAVGLGMAESEPGMQQRQQHAAPQYDVPQHHYHQQHHMKDLRPEFVNYDPPEGGTATHLAYTTGAEQPLTTLQPRQQSAVSDHATPAFLNELALALDNTQHSSSIASSTGPATNCIRSQAAALHPTGATFNACVAGQVLDDRWTAVTAAYGSPKRLVVGTCSAANKSAAAQRTAEQPAAAAAPAAHDEDAASAAPQQQPGAQRSQQHAGSGSYHTSRGREQGSSSSLWRARQR